MTTISKAQARISSKAVEAVLRGTYPRTKSELPDGGGLTLRLNPSAPGGFWFYRYMRAGTSKKIGIGSLAFVGACQAREAAAVLRAKVRQGGDPQPELRIEKAQAHIELLAQAETVTRTFNDEALDWISKQTVTSQTIKNYERWARTVRPMFGNQHVDTIKPAQFADALLALTYGDMKRALNFFYNVCSSAVFHERAKVNPVVKGAIKDGIKHRAKPLDDEIDAESMPWQQVPELVGKLVKLDSSPRAQAVLMTILAGLRAQEVYGAQWSEFDLAARTWTVPASRMKMKRTHIVPISDAMLAVVERMQAFKNDTDLVFPGLKGQPVDGSSMLKLLQDDLGYAGRTLRGFRRSLRNWGGEMVNGRNRFAGDVMESVIAHAKKGVEGHYYTITHFDERVKVQAAWGHHCLGRRQLKLVA